MLENKIPTEIIELPSKGLLYSKDNPLSSGKIEMKYMTAKEEDILTNQNYIQKGTVLDELMKSLIVSKINYGDLIVGDKNAVMVAARILGYGKDYTFSYLGEQYTVDLTTLENKPFDLDGINSETGEFSFTLPFSKTDTTFKIIDHSTEAKISKELEGLKKIDKNVSRELSTRLKYIIKSVDGNREDSVIRNFVDNYLLAKDSRSLREHIKQVQPDVNLTFTTDSGEEVAIPINLNFFWPDA
jgi:hypothetical protein